MKQVHDMQDTLVSVLCSKNLLCRHYTKVQNCSHWDQSKGHPELNKIRMHGKGEVPLLQAALTAQPLQDAHNGAKSLQQAKNANL